MTARSTEDLVHDLARGVTPVEPVARLRVAVGGIALLWVVSVLSSGWAGIVSMHPVDALMESGLHLFVLLGLVATAIGGVVVSLASSVPGREASARGARAIASIGAAVTLGAGLAAVVASGAGPSDGLIAGSAGCVARAVGIGLLPVVAACFYIGRATSPHLRRSMAWGAAGAVGLGAVAVHASCAMTGAHHVFLGHCLAPVLAGVVLAVPLAALAGFFSHREANA